MVERCSGAIEGSLENPFRLSEFNSIVSKHRKSGSNCPGRKLHVSFKGRMRVDDGIVIVARIGDNREDRS